MKSSVTPKVTGKGQQYFINKYLKGSLFLYPRFDDSRARQEGETYFQFNELLSLGLDFTF